MVSVYPTLLGTYGDGGNVMVCGTAPALHGIEVDVINIEPGDAVPESAELYVLGGGEDSAQTAAANALRADGSLKRAAERRCGAGCVRRVSAARRVLPRCEQRRHPGLGILDIRTDRLPKRAVGNWRRTRRALDPDPHGVREPCRCDPLAERLRPGHSSRGNRQW